MTRCCLAGLVLAMLAGCSEQPETVSQRVIVLGFDGMDPQLATQWMDQGKLPHFARLRREGTFRPLQTSNPAQSPVAWSSFATGLHPGQHGIYDFLRRDAEGYAPAFSISEILPPEHSIDLFGSEIPLSDPRIVNRRLGTPFWLSHEESGGHSTVLRVPVTYPPAPIHRMLSGMGVPDLLGTQGTYTLFTTRPLAAAETGGRAVRMRADFDGQATVAIDGPPHPFSGEPMALELQVQPADQGVELTVEGQVLRLAEGEWSDWVSLEFPFLGMMSVSGTVRFHLLEGYPRPRIYMSPIQIDPRDPAVPISSPPGYAETLYEDIGLYHTIGMPEETWSLNAGHLSDRAYLEMTRTILGEREAMFFNALEQRDSELVVGVFVQTDRVSHMFYRGLDPDHPLYPETGAEARGAIEWIYREADRILGRTLAAMGPNDRLIVMSDHGFAPFRRAVHLNRWLLEAGYLSLQPEARSSDAGFRQVDWSKTRAYAVGLNSIYINTAGREGQGIVEPTMAAELAGRIAQELAAWRDPDTGAVVIREVADGRTLYPGNAHGDAPDLVVGYDSGYRASWQTSLGGVPDRLVEPNATKWSGDHCIDPVLVPGVLFADFEVAEDVQSIADLPALILALSGRAADG